VTGPLMDAVMTYLEGAPGATCSQIAAALQHDPTHIRGSLNRLYARKRVGRQPGFFEERQWRYFSAQTTARPPTASPVIGASVRTRTGE